MLALLDGELHGYAVMQRVGELSDGAVKMGPGTLYGTIKRLLAAGLVDPAPAPPDEPAADVAFPMGDIASCPE